MQKLTLAEIRRRYKEKYKKRLSATDAVLESVVRQIKRGCFRQIKTVRQEASGKHPVTLLSVYLAHWKKQQTTHAY